MTIWRPPSEIRAKVIGLATQSLHLLAAEVRDDAGRMKGVRPLGGSIEFGERREAALKREFAEELGCGIEIVGPWTTHENIFVHENRTGHEFVFAAPVRLVGRSFAIDASIDFNEADGTACRARWFPIAELRRGFPALYPTGLATVLDRLVRAD